MSSSLILVKVQVKMIDLPSTFIMYIHQDILRFP